MDARDLFDLTGKVALVTGSTRGIGRAIAECYASAGARVVISSRKEAACSEAAEAIAARGGEAVAIPCNVSRRDDLEALAERSLGHWGRIDVLVLNAAVNPHFGPLAEIAEGAYDKIMDANLKGRLVLCNLVIPQMAARRDGAVIMISSIAGLKGQALLGAYGLSKAADQQLARNLAVEWGPRNVRVNAIAPGLVRTDMARALWEDPKTYAEAVATYPLGRIGEPEDIAGAALFLAAPAGRFVTGQTLVVDGGSTIAAGRYS